MFDDMFLWNFAKIVLEMFVIIFTSSFEVWIFLFGTVNEAHFVDVMVNLSAGEVAFEMGVLEGIVVR